MSIRCFFVFRILKNSHLRIREWVRFHVSEVYAELAEVQKHLLDHQKA